MQALTLEIILRAVFGLDPGARLDALRDAARPRILDARARSPSSMLPLAAARLAGSAVDAASSRPRRGRRAALRADRRARAERASERDDVLAMLLEARHEDGSPMSKQELRDELHDAARRRPRDDRLRAGLGLRAAGAHARACCARLRAEIDARRRRRLPDRDDPGDAAPQAGAAQRRAAPGQAAGRDRRLDATRRASAGRRTPTSSTTTRRSTRTPTRSGPSASSTSRPAPTPGSRSAAGGGAASARASRMLEMKIVLRAMLRRARARPGAGRRARAAGAARSRSARAAAP